MHLVPDQLAYFNGVVEDRMDPSQMGRVRVRVIGLHPFKKTQDSVDGVPTEELPWMICLLPVTSAAMDGISGSITGLVEGSHVFGLWLDKYRTNGIVLGATSGFYTHKPDPSEGFSDPNGVYPKQLGPTAAALAMGGGVGAGASTNTGQDDNSTMAINPEGAVAGGEETSTYSEDILKQILKFECKKSLTPIAFGTGWLIGYEHIVIGKGSKEDAIKRLDEVLKRETKGTITEEEAEKFFIDDIANTKAAIAKDGTLGPLHGGFNGPRKMVLEVMVYQLTVQTVNTFTNPIALLKEKKWKEQEPEFRKTRWAQELSPARARRCISTFRYGNLSAYGIQSSASGSSVKANSSGFTAQELEMLNRVKNLIYGSSGLARISEQKGLPAYILAGLMAQESGGIQYAKSPTGAIGYFQTTSSYRQDMNMSVQDSYNLVVSGTKAAEFLKASHGMFGNWDDAVRSYNAGRGGTRNFKQTGKPTANATAARTREVREYAPKVMRWAGWFKANAT